MFQITAPKFVPTAELDKVRAKVIAAIYGADLQHYQAAWRKYQDEAERIINQLPDAWPRPGIRGLPLRLWFWINRSPLQPTKPFSQGQVSLILEKAEIWRVAKDRVRYLEELVSAEVYAGGMKGELLDLGHGVGVYTRHPALIWAERSSDNRAEFLQATGRFDEAIMLYTDQLHDECLTDWEIGMAHLRLGECYLALMDSGEDTAELCLAAATNALDYLDEVPHRVWAQRLHDQVT